ncbi:uncharacterized transcriptional regulatory protein TBS1-like [Harpegnathos saltator]|uniref:uncharacterized transcriptional regulatory protein TBS1-like n=1 Tax=Harpegnathos saltator TaxID=610380 RepID=UPI000DBEDDA0|nr:uncharacterized transcriptional regulatory protein TBS1-like [Harpegnathos saltator]
MIITRGTATAVAARWALLLKRETLGRTYHNGGQRRPAVTRSDVATAMLSLCGRTHASHGNDSSNSRTDSSSSSNNNNNNTITFVGTGPQWTISSSCTVALALPCHYYCQRRIGDIAVTSDCTLLVDDHEDEPIARASPNQRQHEDDDDDDDDDDGGDDDDDDDDQEDEDANEAAVVNAGDGCLLNRRDRLRCCA